MTQVFFTSDLHFSHRNIAKFCPHTRPKGDIKVLDKYMVEYWNDTVGIDDVVYNLGDVSFSHDIKQIQSVLSQLNGHHHLIFGNHDGIIQTHLDKLLHMPKHDGKPILSSAHQYLKLRLVDKTLVLFHYPIYEWDGCHKGYYHLHGHIHDRMANVGGRILNVGFDLHGKFLTFDEIVSLLEPLPRLDHFGNDGPLSVLNVPDILDTHLTWTEVKCSDELAMLQQQARELIVQRLHKNNT